MNDHECLTALAERWDGPFERPISWNPKTGQMNAPEWMIKIYKLTKAGNISKNGGGYLHIDYCPLCGANLTEPILENANAI